MRTVPTAMVKATLPTKLVDIIDAAAARALISRASWIRSAILDRAARDGLIRLTKAADGSVYELEMSRVFG